MDAPQALALLQGLDDDLRNIAPNANGYIDPRPIDAEFIRVHRTDLDAFFNDFFAECHAPGRVKTTAICLALLTYFWPGCIMHPIEETPEGRAMRRASVKLLNGVFGALRSEWPAQLTRETINEFNECFRIARRCLNDAQSRASTPVMSRDD